MAQAPLTALQETMSTDLSPLQHPTSMGGEEQLKQKKKPYTTLFNQILWRSSILCWSVFSRCFHETLLNKYSPSRHVTLLKDVSCRFSDSQNNRERETANKSLHFQIHPLPRDGDFQVLQGPRIPLVQFTSRPQLSVNFLDRTSSLGGFCALLEGNWEGKKRFASR